MNNIKNKIGQLLDLFVTNICILVPLNELPMIVEDRNHLYWLNFIIWLKMIIIFRRFPKKVYYYKRELSYVQLYTHIFRIDWNSCSQCNDVSITVEKSTRKTFQVDSIPFSYNWMFIPSLNLPVSGPVQPVWSVVIQ